MRKIQNAPQKIVTPEQIADALLNGSYEMGGFPDVFQGLPAKTKYVIKEIIDRVRTLQQRAIAAEVRADHINERKPNRRINVEKEAGKHLQKYALPTPLERMSYLTGFRDCATLIQGQDDNLPQ